MGEYIKTVVSAVLAVGIISAVLPKDSFFKYVNLLSGIIVMTVIVSPLISVRDNSFKLNKINVENLVFDTNSYIMEEYEKELSENIKKFLLKETNIEFSVSVRADKNDDIIEIKEIEISPYNEEYTAIISDYLGIDEGRIAEK